MANWYTARTKIGRELVAAKKTSETADAVFLPRYKSKYVYQGKLIERERALASGYLFVQGEMDGELWHKLVDRKNVVGFIGGENPTKVSEGSMTDWVENCDANGLFKLPEAPQPVKAKPGDKIKINFGPFAGKVGICKRLRRGGAEIIFSGLLVADSVFVPTASYEVVPQEPSIFHLRRRKRQQQKQKMKNLL